MQKRTLCAILVCIGLFVTAGASAESLGDVIARKLGPLEPHVPDPALFFESGCVEVIEDVDIAYDYGFDRYVMKSACLHLYDNPEDEYLIYDYIKALSYTGFEERDYVTIGENHVRELAHLYVRADGLNVLVSDTLFPGQMMLALANGLVLDELEMREPAPDILTLWADLPLKGTAWYETPSYPSGAMFELYVMEDELEAGMSAVEEMLTKAGYRKAISCADSYLKNKDIPYVLYVGPRDESIMISFGFMTLRIGYSPVEIAPRRYERAPNEEEPMASWLIPKSRAEDYELKPFPLTD